MFQYGQLASQPWNTESSGNVQTINDDYFWLITLKKRQKFQNFKSKFKTLVKTIDLLLALTQRPVPGKSHWRWSSVQLTSLSAPFCIKYIIYIIYKISYLNEEVNCTDLSPQLVFPTCTINFLMKISAVFKLIMSHGQTFPPYSIICEQGRTTYKCYFILSLLCWYQR
jgi:hypothetical protein